MSTKANKKTRKDWMRKLRAVREEDHRHTLQQLRENTVYESFRPGDEEEPFLCMRKMKYLLNAMIDEGVCKFEGEAAVQFLGDLFDATEHAEVLVVCAMCAKKIGTRHCRDCDTRYCGRACQLEHWPAHKAACRANAAAARSAGVVADVD